MVLEKAGVVFEQRTFVRILDICLKLHGAILARIVKQFIQHLEVLEVEGFGKRTRKKHAHAPFEDLNNDGQRIGNEHRSQRGAANDEQFGGLEQHHKVAVLHQIPAYNGAKDDDNPDDRKHVSDGGSCRTLSP
jgi:hypothetical protein